MKYVFAGARNFNFKHFRYLNPKKRNRKKRKQLEDDGGGLFAYGAHKIIVSLGAAVKITNNLAKSDGGGFYVHNRILFEINCFVVTAKNLVLFRYWKQSTTLLFQTMKKMELLQKLLQQQMELKLNVMP